MKKLNTIFAILVLFLLSLNVNAQKCSSQYGVNVSIESLIWDAGPCEWAEFTGAYISPHGTVPSFPDDFPTSFHAVILDIDYNMPHWGNAAHYRFDINLYQYGGTNKPVLVLYKDKKGTAGGIEPIKDAQGVITGFEITPRIDGGNGGGVATTVAMGRSGKQASANNGMYLIVSGRVGTSTGNISCQDSNIYVVDWNGSTGTSCSSIHNRMAQDAENTPDVNVYPNPVQDNLFVETNELEVSNISLLTLDGQMLNHKVSVRQGTDRTQINTSQLSPGMYILNVETPTDNIIKKIIIH